MGVCRTHHAARARACVVCMCVCVRVRETLGAAEWADGLGIVATSALFTATDMDPGIKLANTFL